jgi:hypothetical protein
MTAMPGYFDTHPRAVKQWLDNLPIAHIGETSRQLYTAMREVNRQEDIPVRQRFHFLEGVSEPLNMILPELHKHYAGKPLPLSKKRCKIADLYTQLLRQAILGYEQAIARAIELNRLGWKRVVTTSVHRIFHYSGLLLLNQRLLYRPYQKGLWQQLYWLYQMVESYKLLKAKVTCLDMPSCKTTVGAEFNKLLLHSLLLPNLFRPHELDEVLRNMDTWVEQLATTSQLPTDQNHTYAFTLDTDIPPGLMASNINVSVNPVIDVRYFNLTPLLHYLNQLLSQAKPGIDEIQLARRDVISRRSLILLLNNWGRPSSRDGERRLIQGQAEIAIGVSAIHYIISEGRQAQTAQHDPEDQILVTTPDSVISVQSDSQQSDNSLAAMGFTTDRDVHVDVWESAYFEPEPAPMSWTESIRMKVYSYLNAKVLNISKGGFCIALPHEGVENIQTGELVAIRGKGGEWQLGEIRWMLCPSNAPIRAGIQKLSQGVLPAQLHVQSTINQSQPFNCLIGRDETGNIIFFPNLPFSLQDKNIKLEMNNNTRRFDLLEQLYATPVGSAYYFEWRQTQAKAETSGYDSIWAKL